MLSSLYSNGLLYNTDGNGAKNSRIGFGYDIHRLVTDGSGKALKLGGIVIPDDTVHIVSHSDGDVIYHSLADAILGAIGKGDIGDYFPDDDDSNEGLDSMTIIKYVLDMANNSGFTITNADICVILQYPKLGSVLKRKIVDNLKLVLGFDTNVNLKAKTNEGLDAVGSKSAIACHSVALLRYTF